MNRDIESLSDAHRCEICGECKGAHGANDNPHRPFACPAGPVHPKWPTTIKNTKRAGEIFDQRLAKFWTARTTSFQPRSGI